MARHAPLTCSAFSFFGREIQRFCDIIARAAQNLCAKVLDSFASPLTACLADPFFTGRAPCVRPKALIFCGPEESDRLPFPQPLHNVLAYQSHFLLAMLLTFDFTRCGHFVPNETVEKPILMTITVPAKRTVKKAVIFAECRC